MNEPHQDDLSRVVEPTELHQQLASDNLVVVDLSDRSRYEEAHVPGAVHCDYARLLRKDPPAMGLLPPADALSRLFGELGLRPGCRVVAYDDAGGGKASRLLWTLASVGHPSYALLNGGLGAWLAAGLQTDSGSGPAAVSGAYPVNLAELPDNMADKAWIQQHLGQPGIALLDARSPAEYAGEDLRAARGGHIPGAVNLEWTQALDADNFNRLRPAAELRRLLEERGITPDREIVTYCQTHHRSSLLWLVMRHLGYGAVRGYPGSWSEWGNDSALPVEK